MKKVGREERKLFKKEFADSVSAKIKSEEVLEALGRSGTALIIAPETSKNLKNISPKRIMAAERKIADKSRVQKKK